MKHHRMRTTVVIILGIVGVGAVVAGLSMSGSPTVTRARLERSLERTYANRYVALSNILGHQGVTVASLDSHAICDKGGPTVADHGPGGDWVCQIAYIDPNVPNPDGTAKVEMNVHANGCYTAVGSTKLVGPLNITDSHGNTVVNPANEFDGCIDPASPAAPDGTLVIVKPIPLPGTRQVVSPLTLPAGTAHLDQQRRLRIPLTCAANGPACIGTLNVTLMGKPIDRLTFTVPAGSTRTRTVSFTAPEARRGGMVMLNPA